MGATSPEQSASKNVCRAPPLFKFFGSTSSIIVVLVSAFVVVSAVCFAVILLTVLDSFSMDYDESFIVKFPRYSVRMRQ